MPSSIVHLFVANSLKESFCVENCSQFFLGAISPDAVNLEGFASEEVRYGAHIRSKNVSEWLLNIKAYCKENLSYLSDNSDFARGFIVHLLTDIAWDEVVQPRLFKGLLASGVKDSDLKNAKWQELFLFDNELLRLPEWELIRAELSSAKPVEITTVSEDLLRSFLKKVLEKKPCDDKALPLVLQKSDLEVTKEKVLEITKTLFDRLEK